MVRPISLDYLKELMTFLDARGLKPKALRMNAFLYSDLRKFGRDELEFTSSVAVWKTGLMATWRDIEIWVSRVVPQTTIFIEDASGSVIAHESEKTLTHAGPVETCDHPECENLAEEVLALSVLAT